MLVPSLSLFEVEVGGGRLINSFSVGRGLVDGLFFVCPMDICRFFILRTVACPIELFFFSFSFF